MIGNQGTEKLLTVAEVAELLHVHPNTLRRWSDEGKIASYRITMRGDRRYRLGDVESFLSEMNPYKDTMSRKNGDSGEGPLF
jgi:excisionase family DNA binding protein